MFSEFRLWSCFSWALSVSQGKLFIRRASQRAHETDGENVAGFQKKNKTDGLTESISLGKMSWWYTLVLLQQESPESSGRWQYSLSHTICSQENVQSRSKLVRTFCIRPENRELFVNHGQTGGPPLVPTPTAHTKNFPWRCAQWHHPQSRCRRYSRISFASRAACLPLQPSSSESHPCLLASSAPGCGGDRLRTRVVSPPTVGFCSGRHISWFSRGAQFKTKHPSTDVETCVTLHISPADVLKSLKAYCSGPKTCQDVCQVPSSETRARWWRTLSKFLDDVDHLDIDYDHNSRV